MKRFSKILACILTACLLCGMIVTAVFAEDTTSYQTTNLGYNYDFQSTSVGSTSTVFPSGTGNADTYSTNTVVQGAGENRYYRFASINTKDAPKAYRRDLMYGVYNQTSGTKLNDYSYLTIDFDITADGYAVPIGYEIISETSVTADNKATKVTDPDTGVTTITKTTTTTYYVRMEYYIFYPNEVPSEETLNKAIADQSVKFRTQLDAAIKDIADNNGTQVATTSDDGKTVNVMLHKRVGSAVDGPALTAATVADDYVAALNSYDYASSMAEKRLSYPNGITFNIDNRPQFTEGGAFQSGYHNVYVKFVYEDGEWCVYADGGTSPKKTEFKLSDKVGEWNHFTYAVKSVCTEVEVNNNNKTGYTFGYSKASLFYNGYALASGVTLLSSNAANAAYINPRAINMQPHYSDEFSMGIDNFVATYYPLVEKAYVLDDNGDPTTTRDPMNDVHYTSGDDVVGIDDLFEGTVGSIAECEDVHYNIGYVAPAPNGYVSYNGSGEKIYVPSIIKDIIENQLRDGQYIETTADLKDITPRDGASIDIIAAEGIEVTLSEAGAETHTLTKTENGYRLECINQLKVPTVGSGKNLVYGSYAYNNFDGVSYNSKFVTGQGMDNHGSFAVKTDVTGNSYWSISKNLANASANNGVNGYYQWKLSDWANGAAQYKYNDLIGNYSYAVVDMEFGADRYSALVGYRVARTTPSGGTTTYTIEKAYKTFTTFPSEEELTAAIDAQYDNLVADIEKYSEQIAAASIDTTPYLERISYASAKATVTLSYMDAGSIYLGLRGSSSATSYASTNTQVWLYTVKHGGDWYLSSNSTYSSDDYKLPSDPGQLTHITFVVSVDTANTKVSVIGYADGVKVTSKTWAYPVINLDDIRFQFAKDLKDEDIYAYKLDNMVCNYYEKGYTSGAAKGIDDFVAGDCELWECVDTVWNGRYVSPAGTVKVDDGEASYLKPIFGEALKNLSDGANIVTERGLYDISLGDAVQSINVIAKNGANIHLDAESALHFIVEEVSSEGNTKVYLIRRAGEEDAIHVTVLDVCGNKIGTVDILPNMIINLSDFNAGVYDVENNIYKTVEGWYWDIDGEGSEYGEQIAETITIRDLPYITDKSVTAYPKYATVDFSSGYAYVAYYNDNGVIRIADETVANFLTATGITETLAVCPDKTTIKFIFEGDSIVLPKSAYYTYSGKAITFDLNGKTITRYNVEPYGEALIRIGEGATAIVTSTEPGARIFLLSKRNSTVEGNGNNRIFGADGIVQSNKGVDKAHIEISNLEFNGGTMVKFNGGLAANAERPAWDNDVSITCKIDNVIGYAPNRSSYAVISTLCPDAVVEVTNSKFYIPDATYAFVHDYADTTSATYYSETDLTIRNSEILCYTEAETPAMGKLWYTMGADSSLYVENSKIIAKLNGVRSAQAYWGAGVEIATDTTGYFKADNIDDGVKYVLNNGKGTAEMSLSFTRSAFTTNWSYADETNGKYIDSAYTDTVDISRSAIVTFATFTDETMPDYVAYADWYKADGSQSGEYTLTIVGDIPKAPISFADAGYVTESTSWYKSEFVWVNNIDGNPNMPDGFSGGAVAYKAVETKTAALTGLQANMSLSVGLVFNLYIPKADTVAEIACEDAISITEVTVRGVEMICISFANALDDFEELPVTITYTVNGDAMQAGVTIDALTYLTAVANGFDCGSEEAQLAYEIVAYKFAVAVYLTDEAGEEISEDVITLVDTFNAIYGEHAEGCECMAGLYNDDVAANAPDIDLDAYDAAEIYSISYILNSTSTGMFIDAATVTKVTYKNLLGEVVEHTEENGGLVYDDDNMAYRVVGITAADVVSEMTIYVDEDTSVTYSLAQYIKDNDGVDVTKALYSYSMAARAYKAITASEKAANEQ